MRSIWLAAAGLPVILWAAPAHAQNEPGFYVALSAGQNMAEDTDIRYYDTTGTFGGTGTTDSADTTADLKSAATFGGAIGYDFGTVRTDVEVSYARNRLASLTVKSVNGAAVVLDPTDIQDICDYLEASACTGSGNTIRFDGGRIRQLSALANLWVDLPIGDSITPYFGGGIGATGFESDGEGAVSFSWQLGAGVAAKVTEGVSLTLDYRYRSTSGKNVAYDANSGFETGTIKGSALTAGLRFHF
ncbi:MAG: outer membrane beta-barrel protein [Sphingomonas sp.]|uniref:outer membrane protein n=1 Tax=Sphingomonas sp. TaxID=28214 RepID=UPI00262678A9|nr:outer membrane beta-barrel protein [Sphingomonas sp.]MDK2768450.1 outer membrane beta-barrel protein [Sphingomonas sp.]